MNEHQEFIEKWEAKMAKGWLKYIIKHGLLFGLFMFLFTGLSKIKEDGFDVVFMSGQTIKTLTINLLGGFVYSTFLWIYQDKKYKKIKKQLKD